MHVLHLRAIIQSYKCTDIAKGQRCHQDSGQELLSNQGVAFYFFRMNYVFVEMKAKFLRHVSYDILLSNICSLLESNLYAIQFFSSCIL